MSKIFRSYSILVPKFIHSCRDYFRNKSHPRKRLIEDAQQSRVKRVARGSDSGLFNFKSQCFYSEKPCIDHKKHSEIASIMDTKIYTFTLEICRYREGNCTKSIESQLLGIGNFAAGESRYHSACGSSL